MQCSCRDGRHDSLHSYPGLHLSDTPKAAKRSNEGSELLKFYRSIIRVLTLMVRPTPGSVLSIKVRGRVSI